LKDNLMGHGHKNAAQIAGRKLMLYRAMKWRMK
jgi:hypothetical protein